MPTALALGDLLVVDLSDSVAGQFAARLLADCGADVVLVERPEGSATRRFGPFHGGKSLLHFHLNYSKRRMAENEAERQALPARSDVVFTSDWERAQALKRRHPSAIVVAVTDFAPFGPYAHWCGSEMIHQALSGLMFMTGRADREPLYGFGHRASYSTGAAAAVAALAAVVAGGQREAAWIDIHSLASAMSQNLVTQYSYNGSFPRRGQYAGACDIFRCRDGWVVLFCLPGGWPRLCAALGLPELAADPVLATQAGLVANWRAAAGSLAPHLLDRAVDDVVASAQAARVTAARVMSPREILACPHLAARSFWETVETADGKRPVLGPIFRMRGTPRRLRTETGPAEARPQPAVRKEPAEPPLRGIRVIELTTAWAGPFTARILASLGAEVVKIEGREALDAWRGPVSGGESFRYPDGVPGERPYDRNAWFNTQNNNKLSLALDLKSPRSKEVMTPLIAASDVVINNYGTGALERLGLGYDALQAINRGIILLQMPATGEGGPLSGFLGVGPTMEALGGFPALTGYGDGVPHRTGPAYVDPIGGLNGAVAILAALAYRRKSGVGQRIELAQREALMHWLGEELLYTALSGKETEPSGNAVAYAAPHDAYQTAGDDEWIAISVVTDAQWRTLADVLGLPELLADERFASRALRHEHREALRGLLSAATRRRENRELASALQDRGVCAAPVLSGRGLHDDPQLAATGMLVTEVHPAAGTHRYQSLPAALRSPAVPPTPAPMLGEHSRLVLSKIAGLDEARIAGLLGDGTVYQLPDNA